MDRTEDFHLTPKEHDRRYETRIKPQLLDRVMPSDQPRAILLGGQSGAGKSIVANAAIAELGGDMAVVRIDTDEIRTFHPRYAELAASGKMASNATQPDAQKWRDQLEHDAITQRKNIVIDGTMGWPENVTDTALRLRDAGYHVEARVISAHSMESQLGTVRRYYDQVLHEGGGRWVNKSYHDGVYERIPQSLEALEEKKLVQAIRVLSRDGGEVHSQRLDLTNAWTSEKMASQSLRENREERGKDPAVIASHFKGWDALEKTLDQLVVSASDREELAELRRAHELVALGKVEKRGEKAESFLNEKPIDVLKKFPDDKNIRNAYAVLKEANNFSQTLDNSALQSLVVQSVKLRLADSLDTGKEILNIQSRDYEQLRTKLEREGPTKNNESGDER